MAFITMPAPKVGTTFYDKPGNGRKLHKLKRLQDNKVICTPANDDGKEALILPIEAWEKLTGYKIGPDLLATMTFSPSAPPAEPKPAKAAKPAKPAKTPAAPAPAPAPAPAMAAPLAATISQDFARALSAMLTGQPVSMRLAGDSNAATRQQIMETLTGVKTPKSKAGVNAIERVLFEKLGIGTKGLSLNDQTRQLTARLEEIAAGTPAAMPGPEAVTPGVIETPAREPWQMTKEEYFYWSLKKQAARLEEIGDPQLAARYRAGNYQDILSGKKRIDPNGDFGKLFAQHKPWIVQSLAKGLPVPDNVLAEYPDLAAARIVKPALPADAQPLTVEIRQIHLNGDSGNLTNINPQRLAAMVANIRSKKRADNGEIVVEMWAPDPQCAFGASQHGPLAQYKIVDGLEQLQAIMHFLDQEGMGGATENIKIPVMLTQPAEPAMTDQQIEQAIVAALEDFNEPIAFTQPAEPAAPAQPLAPVAEAAEAPNAEDYDEQGRLRPSGMNKKQVKEAIAELVADGWRLVTKQDMGQTRMRLVHEERRIASYPGYGERFLLIAMRTKMYGPSEKYFQDWLDEEGVQPPAPTAPAQPKTEQKELSPTAAAAEHWEAAAKAQEAAAQSEIAQGLPHGDVSVYATRANTYHQVATDMWEQAAKEGSDAANLIQAISQAGAAWWEEETAKAAAAAAVPQPAVQAPTINRIEVKLEQLAFRNNSWDVSDDVLKPIMYNLAEYGPQATSITACVSSYNPNIYVVLSGDEYVTAAVRLKWNTVALTVVERPFDPVIEEYSNLFIGHNSDRQALYEDAKGVRFMIINGVQDPEPILMVPARGGGITKSTNRTNRPEYKTRDELEAERAWAALVVSGAPTQTAAPAAAPAAPTALPAPTIVEPVETVIEPVETVIEPVEIPAATVPLAQIHCAEKRGVTDSTRNYYAELAAKIEREPSSYVIDVWAWPQDDCLDGRQHYSLTTNYAMENYLKAMRDVLKWTDIPINICQRTEEPFVTEQDGRKFVGHNGKGLALYEDKHGVRSYVEEGWWQTEAVSIIPVKDTGRGTIIETGVDRQAHPNYKTFREIVDDGKREVNLAEQAVKGVESYAPEAPTPAAKGPFAQPVQVMGVGDQITVAGAAMLDEKQPKVHYYPGKVDLLFGLYPPTKMNGRNFINLGSSGSFIMPKETREGHSIVSDMLMQLGVDLARPQHFGTTLRSPIATTGAQGIIGYDNYADPLNGEANRFNRTSGLIESNQFLTWRCNIPGFWRIHIAYDASDTYTVRMWRALDPLISKAVGEVVEEFDNVYFPDLRRLVDLIYDHACNKYNDGAIDLDARDWAPLMNPNIPTISSRPAPRRRQ